MNTKVPCTVCHSTRYKVANAHGICRKCERRYEYVLFKIGKQRGVPIDFLFRDKYKAVLGAQIAKEEGENKGAVQQIPAQPLPSGYQTAPRAM
jgi:hypothetical protein